jgi:hypothetical protein
VREEETMPLTATVEIPIPTLAETTPEPAPALTAVHLDHLVAQAAAAASRTAP